MNSFNKILINWYDQKKYSFPWRDTSNPYYIWVSEIMLQQTQVNTVIPFYKSWIKRFPTINDVAKASDEEIFKYWEGLGYYQRALNLREACTSIIDNYNSDIPQEKEELLNLKGIGDYTASAILSIAFKKEYPAIDGNLKRIISRVYAISNNSEVIKKAKVIISQLMKNQDPGDVNQALMDMGRNICTPQNPKCVSCVFEINCIANKKQQIDKYPEKVKAKNIPQYNVIVGLVKKNNKILISKRRKNVLLGGLWELPGGKKLKNESNIMCLERELKEELDIKVNIENKIGTIKHQYSHFKINLTGYSCNLKSGRAKSLASDEIKWIGQNQINKFAFPKSTLKFLSLLGD